MSDEANPTIWYFREGGVITSTASDVAGVAPMLRANAYQKAICGEALTDDERAAVEAARGQSLIGSVSGNVVGDVGLGFLFTQAPELVHQLDDLIGEWAKRLGHPDFLAWQLATEYAQRALAVTMDEAGMGGEDSASRALERSGEDPERIAKIQAEWARQEIAGRAWEASAEGQAALAAQAPDDGPEGWSTVPPSNPNHPNHPDKRDPDQESITRGKQ